jgi:hypothetical protein
VIDPKLPLRAVDIPVVIAGSKKKLVSRLKILGPVILYLVNVAGCGPAQMIASEGEMAGCPQVNPNTPLSPVRSREPLASATTSKPD